MRAGRLSAIKTRATADAGLEREARERDPFVGQRKPFLPGHRNKVFFQQIHCTRGVAAGASAAVEQQELHIASRIRRIVLSKPRFFQRRYIELLHAQKRVRDALRFLRRCGGEHLAELLRHDLP